MDYTQIEIEVVGRIGKVILNRPDVRNAERVAENDWFQLRMIKLAVNQAQDSQGFTAHISAAHSMQLLSTVGERRRRIFP